MTYRKLALSAENSERPPHAQFRPIPPNSAQPSRQAHQPPRRGTLWVPPATVSNARSILVQSQGGRLMRRIAAIALFAVALAHGIPAQPAEIAQKLTGFDAYMEKVLKDWNAPGIGVGVVVNDQLVFAKGYGYRDYEKKLPFTPTPLCPIASNTKLFTAVSAGMLVEEGKLTWDKPIRQSVPAIQFYNDELNNTVPLHDMLSHRTGITRHDTIWYKSEFTRKELFDRLKYLEPQQPIRQMFLYNNMMYAATGYVIELESGKPWEQFVREHILTPLGMDSTVYSIPDMVKGPDHGVPFTEKRSEEHTSELQSPM